MKLLIVSATLLEIKPLISKVKIIEHRTETLYRCCFRNFDFDILICGISLPATVYNLTSQLHKKKYDLVIGVGICGSFNSHFSCGSVVCVSEEVFSDLGVENSDCSFSTVFEIGLLATNAYPFSNGKLINQFCNNYLHGLPLAKSITTNTASGCAASIAKVCAKFSPDIENMEGGGFFYVCLNEGVDFLEFRSVSNRVEPRCRANWQIELAVENLNKFMIEFLSSFF